MRLIENLLCVRRQRCEERRRHLAELHHLAQRLRADAWRLQTVIATQAADGDPESVEPLALRLAKVERSAAAIETQIGLAGAALAAAEEEQQRYELAATRRNGAAGLADGRRRRPGRRPSPLSVAGPDRRR